MISFQKMGKFMRSYIIAITIAASLLTSCYSSGYTHYSDLSESVNHEKAQIILYYPHSIFWSEKINSGIGNNSCALKSGEFLVKEITPSDYTNITAIKCSGLGRSLLVMKTVAGRKYYIRVHPKDNNTVADIIANYGFSESLATASKQELPLGDFDINIIEKQDAEKELASLKLCKECK